MRMVIIIHHNTSEMTCSIWSAIYCFNFNRQFLFSFGAFERRFCHLVNYRQSSTTWPKFYLHFPPFSNNKDDPTVPLSRSVNARLHSKNENHFLIGRKTPHRLIAYLTWMPWLAYIHNTFNTVVRTTEEINQALFGNNHVLSWQHGVPSALPEEEQIYQSSSWMHYSSLTLSYCSKGLWQYSLLLLETRSFRQGPDSAVEFSLYLTVLTKLPLLAFLFFVLFGMQSE